MENKFFRKKNGFLKITAIFALLLLIVIYACEKELSDSNSKEEAQAIEKAKAWYEANKPVETLLRSSDGKNKMLVTPEWKDAYTMKTEKYETIETNLMSYGRILFLDQNCVKKFEETQNPNYKQCYTHIVFCINRSTKDTVGFLMTMVPNVEWLEKSKFKPFLEDNYLSRSKKFGGSILYHNLDGSFSNGWRYENGKIVASISSLDVDSAVFELRSTVCIPVTYIVPVQNCTDLYVGTEYNGVELETNIGQYCTTTYTTSTGMECYDNGDGSGGYNPGDGGGPSTTPQVTLNGQTNALLLGQYNYSVSVSNTTFKSLVIIADDQYTMYSGSSQSCYINMKRPGQMKLKAIVNGNYTSNELTVTVQFPDVNTIKNAETVSDAMIAAWAATKAAASPAGMSEKGFWIYTNSSTMVFECGPIMSGPNITGCAGTQGEISPGSTTDSPASTPLSGGKYAVAYFHTHTPLTYCPANNFREVGPSEEDISAFSSFPGLLYDYAGSYLPNLCFVGICGGHNINDPAQIYTIGASRRATP